MAQLKFCPYINSECKGNRCRMWYSNKQDCMVGLDLESQMSFYGDQDEYTKIGLERIDKDLSKLFTKNYLERLSSSSTIADSDRLLIENLVRERMRLESTIDLKKGLR